MSKHTTLDQLKLLAQRTKVEVNAVDQKVTTLSGKVDALELAGGQPNVIEGVKVNGAALAIADKLVDILIATGATNGTLSVNGVDVAVKGLAALAYKAQVSQADLDDALAAVLNAKAEQSAIDTLNGTGEGSVKKAIDDAFNDFSTKVTDDAVVNSYKELIDWAATHGGEAAEMAGAISDLEALIGTLPEGATSTTVVAYITEVVNGLKIGDYAKKVVGATAGNFAGLDADGNLTDSGKKAEDFVAVEAGKRLMTDEEGAKLAAIDTATDAEVNAMLDEVFGAAVAG